MEDLARPSSVRGPVECCAFSRLARTWAGVAMVVDSFVSVGSLKWKAPGGFEVRAGACLRFQYTMGVQDFVAQSGGSC